jgi:hypothetical protein
MRRSLALAAGIAVALTGTPAMAQFVPPPPVLEGRIPAPLPPPPQPPVISGPLQQAPPPKVHLPQQLDTHSDRTVRCLQRGAGAGLRGGELDAYTRECANN